MPLEPGNDIPLTNDQQVDLAAVLTELIDDLEAEHATAISDSGIWWQWYDAVPDAPTRSDPWPGASNLVVPLIKSMSNAAVSRAILSLFSSTQYWTGSTRDEEFFKPRLANILSFLNYEAVDQLFDAVNDGVTEDFVIGETHWYQRWLAQERYVIPPNARTAEEMKPVRVLMHSGPWVDTIPRERILYPFGDDPRHSDLVVMQNPMSWGELSRQAQLGGWDAEAIEDDKRSTGIEGPGGDVLRQKRRLAGQTGEPASAKLDSHDIRVCHINWAFFKSLSTRLTNVPNIDQSDATDIQVRAIVTLHRKSRRIYKAIYDPHPMLEGWPIYRARYRNGQSRGLAKDLEHLQRGETTTLNQTIDGNTLANSMRIVTSDENFQRRGDFIPNTIPFISDVGAIKELGSQKQVFPDLAVMNSLQAWAERVAGQGDTQAGRETSRGGHPQPATNFLGLLQQSQVNATLPMRNIRRTQSQIGEDRALLYQRHERNRGDWIQQVFGESDATQILDWLNSRVLSAGRVRFDLHALSEIHNPDAEIKKAILVDQVTSNYYVKAVKFMEMIANPQSTPEMKAAGQKAISASSETLTRVLEAAEVDEIENFVLQMSEATNGGIDRLDQFSGLLRESAQGAAPGAQGPIPGRSVAALPEQAAGVPGNGGGAGGL